MISALYFSLSQRRRTEVSRPPEYATTIFIKFKIQISTPKEDRRRAGR
jgi:hypothetical protein